MTADDYESALIAKMDKMIRHVLIVIALYQMAKFNERGLASALLRDWRKLIDEMKAVREQMRAFLEEGLQ